MEASCFLSDTDDFDQYIEGLLAGKKPSQDTIAKICEKAKEVLAKEPNVVSLKGPITICGNISGELENLLEIFHLVGKPPDTNFVFLGNYFHRGSLGVETFSLILALKVRYKNRITLLRGMGEDRRHTQSYGFYDECNRKYGNHDVWRLFADVFDYLPLCAVIDESYFCLAGGLTPETSTIEQIQKLDRFRYRYDPETPDPVLTMIWSDPHPGDAQGWGPNYRGLGYYFPKEESKKFLHINKLKLICRFRHVEMDVKYLPFANQHLRDSLMIMITRFFRYVLLHTISIVVGIQGQLWRSMKIHKSICKTDKISGLNFYDSLKFYCPRKREIPPRDLDYFSRKNIGVFYDKLYHVLPHDL